MATPGAIRFRGIDERSPKLYRGTTHRAVAPEETLARIEPLLGAAGITRVADITGLDRLGIPVTMVLRPNSRLIVGATGKGTTVVNAQVSGLMEAIEVHHAEYAEEAPLAHTWSSYRALAEAGAQVVALDQLPIARHCSFDPEWVLDWVSGFDLIGQVEVPVPMLLVHLAPRFLTDANAAEHRAKFMTGSNGLASGNTRLEAVAAALYELIERDGISVWAAAERQGRQAPTVDLDHLDAPEVLALVERCRRADFDVRLVDWTTDLGVPTYGAMLFETEGHGFDISTGGFGTHLDPEVAMVRAITEAAQSRAVGIAGSRDDFTTSERVRPRLHRVPDVGPNAPTRCSAATDSFEGDVGVLLDRLRVDGVERAIVTELRREPFGIDVVKAWVPGLEEYFGSRWYRPGRRAAEALVHTDPERLAP